MFKRFSAWYMNVLKAGKKVNGRSASSFRTAIEAYTPTAGQKLKAAGLITASVILGLFALVFSIAFLAVTFGPIGVITGIVAAVIFAFVYFMVLGDDF